MIERRIDVQPLISLISVAVKDALAAKFDSEITDFKFFYDSTHDTFYGTGKLASTGEAVEHMFDPDDLERIRFAQITPFVIGKTIEKEVEEDLDLYDMLLELVPEYQ